MKKSLLLKIIPGGILAISLSLLIILTSSNTDTKTIRSVYSFNSGFESFQNEVINIGLKKLGYKMNTKKSGFSRDNYIAIANGDFDYTTTYNTNPWSKQAFEEAGGKEKLKIVGTLIPNFIGGYQIDKKTADKYKIINFQQLQDEKIAKLFDSDGNDKANIAHCNAPCEHIRKQLKAYGLENTVEYDTNRLGMCNMRLFVESRPCYEKTLTRYQEGKPILYYASQPEWIFSVLKQGQDVVCLEVPFTLDNLTEKDTLVDGKNLGFPIIQQRIVANKKFIEANPVAKRWLELVQIPLTDFNSEELRIKEAVDRLENNFSGFTRYRLEKIYSFLDRKLGNSHRQAKKWVKNNQQKFDRWLKEAKQVEVTTFNKS